MSKLNVTSEVGKLKKVLLHRPGLELEHLTPKWLNQLLFDDIPWLDKAQEEHDEFRNILVANGVEVVYLDDLVVEALADKQVKNSFINQFIKESSVHNKNTIKKLKAYLNSLSLSLMVKETMAGIPKTKLEGYRLTSLKERIDDYPFLTDPMPNLYFTRDPFSVIAGGVTINKMFSNVRQRETIYAEYIFKYHKQYHNSPQFYSRYFDSSIEGGDILVINEKMVAVGISERTDPDAIETLSHQLFEQTNVEYVIAIDMPKKRAFMHLDTILTQVDLYKFLVHHDFLQKLNIYIIKKGSKKESLVITKKYETLKRVFSRLLKNSITMIPCGNNDAIASDREQWNDGANTLAISPGVVIVYERNPITNKLLQAEGIKVIPMTSSELSRGRGGPRCMSMPLYREDLEDYI